VLGTGQVVFVADLLAEARLVVLGFVVVDLAALVFAAAVVFLAVLVFLAGAFFAAVFAVLAFLAGAFFAAVLAVLAFFAGAFFAVEAAAVLVADFFAVAVSAGPFTELVALPAVVAALVTVSLGSLRAPETTSLSCEPGRNFATAVFLARTRSPVAGLRTMRAGRTALAIGPAGMRPRVSLADR
jgi:hypothetical protein